jgi:serine/threonine protein kinase
MSLTRTSNIGAGTAYWMAPELLVNELPATKESDTWALACTYYEVGLFPLYFCFKFSMLISKHKGSNGHDAVLPFEGCSATGRWFH